jgi:hypothetical protein
MCGEAVEDFFDDVRDEFETDPPEGFPDTTGMGPEERDGATADWIVDNPLAAIGWLVDVAGQDPEEAEDNVEAVKGGPSGPGGPGGTDDTIDPNP